ncbi:DNA repair protein XRCC4-like isoform X2 [Actinidia eriantha]|uniref:DNA repair protein XRCC4-like isoform X2 n=1 Tax=Actinidia eriantha TaxID=165200 RepID=UPI002585B7A9|nr:DNA repair protein XRCC4-like isoform X2 [Actinidia eriantha]
MESTTRHSCLKLELPTNSESDRTEPIFVKGTWLASRFDLAITDGLHAWSLYGIDGEMKSKGNELRHRMATEDEVRERASQWDQTVPDYIELAEHHLGFQQPGSVYGFADAGNGNRRLSWTFEKKGTKLEWRWKCKPSFDSKKTTAGILDFLVDANIRLSDEVVRKTQSVERLRGEAEKCLAQSEKFSNEKADFEDAIYSKFLGVLNSKKAKLRELRDRFSKQENTGKMPREEEGESTDKTESFDGESDDGKSEEESAKNLTILTSTSKDVPASTPRGRKRK